MNDVQGLFRRLMKYEVPIPKVPGPCRSQSIAYLEAVGSRVGWAAKMWDSKAKMQPGILTGNLNSLGNYDECLNVRNIETKAGTFSGQYCLPTLSLDDAETQDVIGKLFREVTEDEEEIKMGLGSVLSKGIRWSYCIPSSCTASDLSVDLQKNFGPSSGIVVTVNDDDCSVLGDTPFTAPDYIFLVILFLLMVATLLSTCYDYAVEYLKKKNYWPKDESNITQNPPESDPEIPPAPNPEAPGSSENLNPEAPGSSENLNPEAPGSSGNLNPEAPGSSGNLNPGAPGSSGNPNPEAPGSSGNANPEAPGSSGNANPEAPGSSENPNLEAPGSSENPNQEVQPVERPATLDLPGPRAEPVARVPESGHRDVEAERNELLRTLNFQPQALESPVRDPLPSETDVLTSFSLLNNGRYIFSFNDSRLYLTSVDGIKFLSLCWVMLSYACYVTETLPAINYFSIFKYFSEWPAVVILNTQLAVDTFLVCTGVLISYNFFNDMNRRGIQQTESGRELGRPVVNKIYILVFYLHRFIRLAPALAMIVLLQAGFLHHLGTGPFWKTGNGYLSKVCQETWWGTLLFVQNYIDGDKLCLPHSWYAMVDFQLYLVSPIILLVFLHFKRRKALIIAVGLICLGIASTIFVNYYFDLPVAIVRGEAAKWHLKTKYDYITAYTRLAPWMVGIIVGFLLHHYRSQEREKPYSVIKNRLLIIVGWIITLACFAYSIFGMRPFTRDHPEDSPLVRALYTGFSQTLWAVAVAWIIFVCETGHGGILHESLSQRIFQPLQRLTYCTYLVHLPLMTHRALLTRLPIHVNKTTVINTFFGDLLFSLHLALALCLLVELPFRRVFKTISINYGFAVRFTEEKYVTRRPSDYNQMWDAMNRGYVAYQQSGFIIVPTQTYSTLQRDDRAAESAQESETESDLTNAPVFEETSKVVIVPTARSNPITAALPAESCPSISG